MKLPSKRPINGNALYNLYLDYADADKPGADASPNTVQLAMVMKWAFSLRARPALDCGSSDRLPPAAHAVKVQGGGESKAVESRETPRTFPPTVA
jgi:hypothetical protein